MARRLAAVLLAAVLLAGCGDAADGKPEQKRRRAPDPAQAADQLAIRCGLLRPEPGTVPAIVPPGLLPPGAYIAKGRRTGSAARATILMPIGVTLALQTISSNATKAGFEVIFSEQEPGEAEVYLSGPGGLVKFRMYGSRTCPEAATQALFERSYTEG
jgi:hypothetical protein